MGVKAGSVYGANNPLTHTSSEGDTEAASGGVPNLGRKPALIVLTGIGLLALLRMVWELAD